MKKINSIDWENALGIKAVSRCEALDTIGNTDDYYVYILWKSYTTPIVPFYVGKGHRWRLGKHEMLSEQGSNIYKTRIIKKHGEYGAKPLYSVIDFFDDEQKALTLEIQLISLIGRHDLHSGPLCNRTNGGDGSPGHLAARRGDSASARAVVADGANYPCLQDAADVLSVTAGAVSCRIKNGWDGYYYLDEGQREPKPNLLGRYRKQVVVAGQEFQSASDASRALNIDVRMISKRIGYGWDGYYYLDQGQLPKRTIWGSRQDKVAIEIDGVIYPTVADASRRTGEDARNINKRALSTNFPNYRRLDGKENVHTGRPRTPVRVSIAGKQYPTLQAAAVAHGLTDGGVVHRCRSSNYPEWRYVDTTKQTEQPIDAAFSSNPVSVTIFGKLYMSQSEAAREYGIDINTLKKRCASPSFPDWICSTIEKKSPLDGKPGLIGLEIDSVVYRSVSEAHRATGIARATIKQRLLSPEWPTFLPNTDKTN